jgi:hypothetical protein
MPATRAKTPAKPRPPIKAKTFRIVFWIEGVAYSVLPLKPDPGVATRAYRLTHRDAHGKATSTYDVSLSPQGHVACECKGWLRWLKPCKHIRCLVAAGMIELPPPTVDQPAPAQDQSSQAPQEGPANGQEAA